MPLGVLQFDERAIGTAAGGITWPLTRSACACRNYINWPQNVDFNPRIRRKRFPLTAF
jgi:hypothetical protein